MQLIRLHGEVDFAGWRRATRRLIRRGVAPEDVEWRTDGHRSLLAFEIDDDDDDDLRPGALRVPRAFLTLAQRALLHSDPARFALLYRLVWRIAREPRLMQVASDADLLRARNMAQAVNREIHKTHAFVRFREVRTDDDPVYIAWFEPSHHTLEAAAPFFVKRFSTMRWSILTPRTSAHWNLTQLVFGSGATREEAAQSDGLEGLWRTYYASIFNPARLKTHTMQAHMPRKYWRNMPEAELVSGLVAQAPLAQAQMIARAPTTSPRLRAPHRPMRSAADDTPATDIASLREQACRCTGCPLHTHATQTVFGAGPERADLMFVGEQPGDHEDLAGQPFVGPAGKVFDRALARLGIERSATYVTNAVKHFKFEPRGKRRLHKTPGQLEIEACRGWLEREIALVQPRIIVALGGTAAHTVLGSPTAVQRVRGKLIRVSDETQVLVTVHPSYLLRLPREEQADAFEAFVCDLEIAREALPQVINAL